MKKYLLTFLFFAYSVCCAYAQIGYQVAIIDQSTGKPRSNEKVSVTVIITDNADNVICNETQQAITNSVGVVSLQVGNSSTFENVDWSNLPLWVSAKVDNITISKSQILSVPVAEYAKSISSLDINKVKGKWRDIESTSSKRYWEITDDDIMEVEIDGEGGHGTYYSHHPIRTISAQSILAWEIEYGRPDEPIKVTFYDNYKYMSIEGENIYFMVLEKIE